MIQRFINFILGLFKKEATNPKEGPAKEIILYPKTKEISGKRNRKLQPELRLLIEKKLFKDGLLPESFIERNPAKMAIDVSNALLEMDIKESSKDNHGEMIGLIQGIIGAYYEEGDGLPWCMSFVQVIAAFIEDFLQVESPILDSEHCMSVLRHAKDNGLYSKECLPGRIVIWEHGTSDSGHTGIVVEDRGFAEMATIEGNTGDLSFRNGDKVCLKHRSKTKNGSMIVRGYVSLYPRDTV